MNPSKHAPQRDHAHVHFFEKDLSAIQEENAALKAECNRMRKMLKGTHLDPAMVNSRSFEATSQKSEVVQHLKTQRDCANQNLDRVKSITKLIMPLFVKTQRVRFQLLGLQKSEDHNEANHGTQLALLHEIAKQSGCIEDHLMALMFELGLLPAASEPPSAGQEMGDMGSAGASSNLQPPSDEKSQAHVVDLSPQILQLEEQLAKSQKEAAEALDKLTKEKDIVISALQKKLTEVEFHGNMVETQHKSAQSMLQQALATIDELKTMLKQKEQEISQLKPELELCKAHMSTATERAEAAWMEVGSTKKALAECCTAREAMKLQLEIVVAESDGRIKELEKELVELKVELQLSKISEKRAAEDLSETQQARKTLLEKLEKLEIDSRNQILDLERKLQNVHLACAQEHITKSEAQRQLEKAEHVTEEVQQELRKSEERERVLKTQNDELHQKLHERQQSQTALSAEHRTQLDILQKQLSEWQAELVEQKAAFTHLESESHKWASEKEAAERKLIQLKQEWDQQKAQDEENLRKASQENTLIKVQLQDKEELVNNLAEEVQQACQESKRKMEEWIQSNKADLQQKENLIANLEKKMDDMEERMVELGCLIP